MLCGITMYFYFLFVFTHRAGSSCQNTAKLVQIYSDTAHQNIYYDIRISNILAAVEPALGIGKIVMYSQYQKGKKKSI